jgi:hypothetical protein
LTAGVYCNVAANTRQEERDGVGIGEEWVEYKDSASDKPDTIALIRDPSAIARDGKRMPSLRRSGDYHIYVTKVRYR